ncbi:MAG: winged helix DNA-binding protein [Dehalococcoidales bacterium]
MKKLSTDADYNLWMLLVQTRNATLKARKKELTAYHISPRQSAILFFTQATEGKVTATEIARWLILEPHTISELLKRMEKDGLITKVKGSSKKRSVKIALTEKGRQAYHQSLKRESIRDILSCLSEAEQEQLRSSLKKIRDKALEFTLAREFPFS